MRAILTEPVIGVPQFDDPPTMSLDMLPSIIQSNFAGFNCLGSRNCIACDYEGYRSGPISPRPKFNHAPMIIKQTRLPMIFSATSQAEWRPKRLMFFQRTSFASGSYSK
jgi:hypothetical protein